ncbi:MAG: hypothetical protein JXR48_15495 [Candidatus Delongbacteria bacterium]|jgi:hypothetical protein|nr:hypothetical protein [Candidatus Delongbacteria bacterium]
MKTHALTVLISMSFALLYANELSWVDEQINAIKPPREGINLRNISQLSNPFIFLEKNKTKKKEKIDNSSVTAITSNQSASSTSSIEPPKNVSNNSLELRAIFNKSVLIGGAWYKKNDVVHGHLIKTINLKSVVLLKDGKELVLTTQSKNLNLKFNNK